MMSSIVAIAHMQSLPAGGPNVRTIQRSGVRLSGTPVFVGGGRGGSFLPCLAGVPKSLSQHLSLSLG
jgi:hypothetical protein